MRNLKRLLLSLLLLLGIAIPLGMTLRPTGTGTVEGFVVDERGAPIRGASIQAFDTMRGGCCSVASEPNGFYRIANLGAGRYSLWAEAKGHASKWILMVIVEEGKTTKTDIQLRGEIPTGTTQLSAAH
jgi:hypothetical protein